MGAVEAPGASHEYDSGLQVLGGDGLECLAGLSQELKPEFSHNKQCKSAGKPWCL